MPFLPGIDEIVSGIISALFKIFLEPGETAIKEALNLLLTMSDGPNFMSDWVWSTYLLMWGLGVIIALINGTVRATVASYTSDTYKFFDSLAMFLKSYLFGMILPILFTAAFLVASGFSREIVRYFTASPEAIDELSVLDAGNVIGNIVMVPTTIILGVVLGLVIWLTLLAMPVLTFIAGPLLFSLSDGKRGGKLYAAFWGLAATSILSGPFMALWIVGTRELFNGLVTSQPSAVIARPYINAFILGFAILIPYWTFKGAHNKAQEVIARGLVSIQGQVRTRQDAGQAATPPAPATNSSHAFRNLVGLAVAGSAGYAVAQMTEELTKQKEADAPPPRSAQAYQAVGQAAHQAAAKRAATGGSIAGTLGMSGVSIAASRAAARKQRRHSPQHPPTPPTER